MLEAAVREHSPWSVVECVPSYADRIFSAACNGSMKVREREG